MIFVCGLSRTGKSTLIERANVTSLGFRHVRVSQLLTSIGRPVAHLSPSDVLLNQVAFVSAAKMLVANESRSIVMDGHLVVESIAGPQIVPEAYLDVLPLAAVVLIQGTPEEISTRRGTSELCLTADEAAELMQIEQIQATRLARRREISLTTLGSSELSGFLNVLNSHLGLKPTD